MTSQASRPLNASLVRLMALATGLSVASNYYAQPLLAVIARQVGLSTANAGYIVTTAQISYALGLLCLVPLGDLLERRRLIVVMTVFAAVGLAVSATAPGVFWLLAGTAITGLFSVVAQILVPFAATLAAPEQRGKVLGTVMSGLLLGILLARTVAGAIASLGSWRTVYGCAAFAMLVLALALSRALPVHQTSARLSYPRLLGSVWQLYREEPVFRLRSLLGALSFCAFAILWTSLTFLLSDAPYHYSPASIGLFGLVGAAGALAANQAGRLADRGKSGLTTTLGLLGMLLAWLGMSLAAHSLVLLIAGILLMDLAAQSVHISNQSQIYRLRPEARSRFTAGYMTCYFIGGSVGSSLAAAVYPHGGWVGVSLIATGVVAVALGVWLFSQRRGSVHAGGEQARR